MFRQIYAATISFNVSCFNEEESEKQAARELEKRTNPPVTTIDGHQSPTLLPVPSSNYRSPTVTSASSDHLVHAGMEDAPEIRTEPTSEPVPTPTIQSSTEPASEASTESITESDLGEMSESDLLRMIIATETRLKNQ
jgi:hypothetical protein